MSLLQTGSYNYNLNTNDYSYPSSPPPLSINFRHPNQIPHPPYRYKFQWGSQHQRHDRQDNMVLNSPGNFAETSTSTNSTADDSDDSKVLGVIVAFLGLTGLFVPFLTLASIPLQLLNPNLIIAKSLAFLSIPVAILSYGRSLQDKTAWMDIAKRIDEETSDFLETLAQKLFRTDYLESESRSLFTSTRVKGHGKNFRNEKQQCMERIACEGLFKSIPQIFLKSVLKGQEGMFRSLQGFGNADNVNNYEQSANFENQPPLPNAEGSKNQRSARIFTATATSRRKHLAKYAMSKIKNRDNLFTTSFNNSYKNDGIAVAEEYGCSIFKCSIIF